MNSKATIYIDASEHGDARISMIALIYAELSPKWNDFTNILLIFCLFLTKILKNSRYRN